MSKGTIDGSIQIENSKMSNNFKCPRSKPKISDYNCLKLQSTLKKQK